MIPRNCSIALTCFIRVHIWEYTAYTALSVFEESESIRRQYSIVGIGRPSSSSRSTSKSRGPVCVSKYHFHRDPLPTAILKTALLDQLPMPGLSRNLDGYGVGRHHRIS